MSKSRFPRPLTPKQAEQAERLGLSEDQWRHRRENGNKIMGTLAALGTVAALAGGIYHDGYQHGKKDAVPTKPAAAVGDVTYTARPNDTEWDIANRVRKAQGNPEDQDIRPIVDEIDRQVGGPEHLRGAIVVLHNIPDQDPTKPGIQLDPPAER